MVYNEADEDSFPWLSESFKYLENTHHRFALSHRRLAFDAHQTEMTANPKCTMRQHIPVIQTYWSQR